MMANEIVIQPLTATLTNNGYGETLAHSASRLGAHLSDYQFVFKNKTKTFFDKAQVYVHGLLMGEKRNVKKSAKR